MNPLFYVDLSLLGGLRRRDWKHDLKAQGPSSGPPYPVMASMILTGLHGAFQRWPQQFALALPLCHELDEQQKRHSLAVLRLFSSSRELIEQLQDAVEEHPPVRDYSRWGRTRKVSGSFDGAWYEYRRFRVPTRRADRHEGGQLRQNRMMRASEAAYPFFQIASRSSGQHFSLIVEPRMADACSEGFPDGYGFSVTSRPFALPHLPVEA